MGTALIYDEEMTSYKLLWDDPECEVEVPERLTVSYEALVRSGLADHCVSIPVREATEEEILLIHSEEYLEKVKKTPHMSVQELKDFALQFNAVYFHPNSYHCAKLAVGAALQLVDHVLMGKVRNGMALVRPPGHHSMRDAACGFCTFNNVAIAAQYAKQKYGLKRVLIVDWDIHHGQGVQYCFEDDPSVLYFSWHRYEHSIFWPHLPESDYDAVGKDKGVGFNINVPWNKVGMTNSDFLSVFCHVLLPVAYEFCPELVLVSAGYDSGIGDPEGGYNLTSLSQSVCQTVQTLLGDPNPRPENLRSPCQSALESIHCVRWAHRRYWSCLGHAADLSSFQISTKPSGSPKEAGESTWKDKVAVVWPEPVKRVAPPVRTAALLSDEAVCPEGCKRLATSDKLDPRVAGKLRENFLEGEGDSEALSALSGLITLTEKMEKDEILNGLAVVRDITMATACVVQHVTMAPNNRVLVVCVGDGEAPSNITEDRKALVVRIGSRETKQSKCKNDIPVCLKKGCADVSGVIQAVFGLLLPLGYEFDPSLVLLVRMPGSEVSDGVWQQLTGLLQCLAQGHVLVLIQECEKSCVSPTACSLLGEPAPPLGQLQAPLPQDVEDMERLRRKLLADWTLLQTTAADTGKRQEL
uniref:Histone deacetylase domain-containing protein n=1 Tax=Salarias fasciatus TaxID=181472 RepID=A0A672HG66_SALFA